MLASKSDDHFGTSGEADVASAGPQEDEPGREHVREMNAYTVLVLFSAVLGGLMFGLDIGTAALTSNQYFREEMGIAPLVPGVPDSTATTDQVTQFAFLFHLSSLIGAPFGGFISDRVGRKPVMVAAAFLFCCGAIWQSVAGLVAPHFAWQSVILGRVLGGIGNGFILTLSPVYASELAPPQTRGKVVTCFQLSITLGILLMAIFNKGIEDVSWGWRLGIALQAIPCVAVIILCMTVLPESPRFLLKKHRDDEAEVALLRLAKGTPHADKAVANELAEIRAEVANEEAAGSANVKDLFRRDGLPAFLCAFFVAFSQNITGVNFLMNWSTTLFNSINLPPFTYDLALKSVNFLATFLALPLIDRAGRKFLTVWGTFFIITAFGMICLVILATGVDVNTSLATDTLTNSVQLFCVGMIFLFQAAFALSWGPLGWVVPAESFSLQHRALGMSIAVGGNMASNIILGDYGYAALYSATSMQATTGVIVLLNLLFVVPTVVVLQPETKGLSMEHMRKVFAFEYGGSIERAHGTMRQFFARNTRQTIRILGCRTAQTCTPSDTPEHPALA